jgi:methionyl-tRNA synthetase
MSEKIRIEEFLRIQLKVAQVLEAKAHPNADKLLILKIDTGGTVKEIVAGIAHFYRPQELVGKSIVVVDNLEPATIRGTVSSGMLLAAQGEGGLSLIIPERPVPPGSVVR